MARCSGTNAQGEPCAARSMAGSEFCYCHSDPDAWKQAQSRGGVASHIEHDVPQLDGEYDLTTAAGVAGFLAEALRETRTGALDTRIANSLAALSNALRGFLEVVELSERVAELEQAIMHRRH